jgi:hypothetical protein
MASVTSRQQQHKQYSIPTIDPEETQKENRLFREARQYANSLSTIISVA